MLLTCAAAASLLLAGCTSDGEATPAATDSAASSPSTTSAAPPSSGDPAGGSEEPAADPATATDPAGVGQAVALRQDDLPGGWTVQANPVPEGAELGASLAGICDYAFTSEIRRTDKFPVIGYDTTGTSAIQSEAIAYDAADGAVLAMTELRAAFADCPSPDRTFEQGPSGEGLASDNVVVQYRLATGFTQVVIAQRRGAVLSVVVGSDPAAAADAAVEIAARLAAAPATAVGE